MSAPTTHETVSGARLAELIRLYTPHPEIAQNGDLWACLLELLARRAAEPRCSCRCNCCDHGEGSDCACLCHERGRCSTWCDDYEIGRLALGQREEE